MYEFASFFFASCSPAFASSSVSLLRTHVRGSAGLRRQLFVVSPVKILVEEVEHPRDLVGLRQKVLQAVSPCRPAHRLVYLCQRVLLR